MILHEFKAQKGDEGHLGPTTHLQCPQNEAEDTQYRQFSDCIH